MWQPKQPASEIVATVFFSFGSVSSGSGAGSSLRVDSMS